MQDPQNRFVHQVSVHRVRYSFEMPSSFLTTLQAIDMAQRAHCKINFTGRQLRVLLGMGEVVSGMGQYSNDVMK
jgi:hypothetical protein